MMAKFIRALAPLTRRIGSAETISSGSLAYYIYICLVLLLSLLAYSQGFTGWQSISRVAIPTRIGNIRSLQMRAAVPVPPTPQVQTTKLLAHQLLKTASRVLRASPPVAKLLHITPPAVKGFLGSLYPAELFFLLAFRLFFRKLLRFAYKSQSFLWHVLKFEEPKQWEQSILGFVTEQFERLAKTMGGIYIFKLTFLVLVQLGLNIPGDFPSLVSRIVYLIYCGRFVDEFKSKFLCTIFPSLAHADSKRQRHMVNQSATFGIATVGFLILSQMLSNFFHIPLSSILAFGGVGGIAVGLSARDVAANFLGGMMLLFNDPFAPSDMVTFKVGSTEVLGKVDRIGWTQTRIKTRETKSLYIPNSHFVQTPVTNNDRITHRKYEATVSIRLQDGGRVEHVVQRIRERLQTIQKLDKMSMPFRVHFAHIGQFSLDIHMVVYFGTKSLDEYLTLQQTANLEVMAAIAECGAQLAIPSTTLHVVGLSPETTTYTVPTASAVVNGLLQTFPQQQQQQQSASGSIGGKGSVGVATTAGVGGKTTAATDGTSPSVMTNDPYSEERELRNLLRSEEELAFYRNQAAVRSATRMVNTSQQSADSSSTKKTAAARAAAEAATAAAAAVTAASAVPHQDLSTHNMFNSVTDVTAVTRLNADESTTRQKESPLTQQVAADDIPSVTTSGPAASVVAAGKDAEQMYYVSGMWERSMRRAGIQPDAHRVVAGNGAQEKRVELVVHETEAVEADSSMTASATATTGAAADLSADDLDVLLDEDDDDLTAQALPPIDTSTEVTAEDKPTAFWEDSDKKRKKRADAAKSSPATEVNAMPAASAGASAAAASTSAAVDSSDDANQFDESLPSLRVTGMSEEGILIVESIRGESFDINSDSLVSSSSTTTASAAAAVDIRGSDSSTMQQSSILSSNDISDDSDSKNVDDDQSDNLNSPDSTKDRKRTF